MNKPKTKAPAPSRKLKDERAEALARMTKAELVRTVKKLDANQTKLLNRIAQYERPVHVPAGSVMAQIMREGESHVLPNPFTPEPMVSEAIFTEVQAPHKFPWEQ